MPITYGPPFRMPHAPPPAQIIDAVQVGNSMTGFDVTIPALVGLLAKTQPRLAHYNGKESSPGNSGDYFLTNSQWGISAYARATDPARYPNGITINDMTPTVAIQTYGPNFPNIVTFGPTAVEAHCAASIAGVANMLPVPLANLSQVRGWVGAGNTISAPANYDTLWAQYGSQFQQAGIIIFTIGRNTQLDYGVMGGAFIFDQITNPNIIPTYPAGTQVLGFWSNNPLNYTGGGSGNEGLVIEYLSGFDIGVHAADRGIRDFSVSSGLKPFVGTQPQSRVGNTITYVLGRKYVGLTFSQGDALGYNSANNASSIMDWLTDRSLTVAGSFPVANVLQYIAPHLMAFYYNIANNTNGRIRLFASPGVNGYVHIHALTNPSAWFTEALKSMQNLGHNEIFFITDRAPNNTVDADITAQYMPAGSLCGLFRYQNLSGGTTNPCGGDHWQTSTGRVPVLNSSFATFPSSYDTASAMASAIQTVTAGCDFCEIMVNTSNGSGVAQIFQQAMSSLGSNYVSVRSDELLQLMAKANLYTNVPVCGNIVPVKTTHMNLAVVPV